MRRLMLLALLALALPVAALASSVIFETGTFDKGTVTTDASGGFSPGSFTVQVFGSKDTITISSPILSSGCESGSVSGFCSFGGHITVTNSAGQMVFQDSLTNGNVHKGVLTNGLSTAVITGLLFETLGPPRIVTADANFSVTFSKSGKLVAGSGQIINPAGSSAVPEPGTLGLLGTGLIGLAGWARRKLKLSA